MTESAPSSGRFSTYVRLAAEEARILLSEHAVPEDAHPGEPIVARRAINRQVRQSEHSVSPFRQRPSTARTAAATSLAPGQVRVLERWAERDRCERRADAPDRRVELVERGCLHLRGDLGAEAAVHDRLVRDDEPVRPGDRLDDRLEVERNERARVDHLDLDPLGRELLGGGERLRDEARERDHGDVAAGSDDARAADAEPASARPGRSSLRK